MSTLVEGLNGSLTVNGTFVVLLAEAEFDHSRAAKEWADMGSTEPNDVLMGVNKYKLTAKHGYVNNDYQNYVRGGSALIGTLYPRGDANNYIAGTFYCNGSKISGMKHESEDPVMEDLTFIVVSVTFSSS
jgi:hypothetical protein